MIIHLPDPVGARVLAVEENRVTFLIRDAGHADAFHALLEKALKGYAVELRLIHYEGHSDATKQAEARRAKKAAKRSEE